MPRALALAAQPSYKFGDLQPPRVQLLSTLCTGVYQSVMQELV
jgi:hypothetical protein